MTDYQFLLNQEKKATEINQLAAMGTILLIFGAGFIWLFL